MQLSWGSSGPGCTPCVQARVRAPPTLTPAASSADEYDDRQPLTSKEEEERRIAEMGRPVLGEHTRLEVIIEESYEFKVRRGAGGPGTGGRRPRC